MIGNPAYYSEEFRIHDAGTFETLKNEYLVDTILVNIAFSRPYIDPVLLEHIVRSQEFPLTSDKAMNDLRLPQLKERVRNVHAAGMKAICLFGIPLYTDYSRLPESYGVMLGAKKSTISVDNVTCILSEATLRYYRELISLAVKELDIDGMLVYSYDEFAEVCDEDTDCPRCKGIPLEDRLPGFLNKINAHCKSLKKDFELWWEPWELSASQVYLCLGRMDKDIAVSVHSTLHEVSYVNHPDIFVRNVSMIAKRQGRKMIVEGFFTGCSEETGPIAGFPCPRLVYEQIKSLELLEGVTGIKEYYGMAIPFISVNEKAAAAALRGDSYDNAINALAAGFSKEKSKQDALLRAWDFGSHALLTSPWDMSWVFRLSNLQPYSRGWWGKRHFKDTMKTPWKTPSWESNRRSYYLIVDGENNLTPHMWRDFDKRIALSLDYAEQAMKLLEGFAGNRELKMQYDALKTYHIILSSRRNYMNLCNMLTAMENGKDNGAQIRALLEHDLVNAREYISHTAAMGIGHYFDPKQTLEGIAYIETILKDTEGPEKYFDFLK